MSVNLMAASGLFSTKPGTDTMTLIVESPARLHVYSMHDLKVVVRLKSGRSTTVQEPAFQIAPSASHSVERAVGGRGEAYEVCMVYSTGDGGTTVIDRRRAVQTKKDANFLDILNLGAPVLEAATPTTRCG